MRQIIIASVLLVASVSGPTIAQSQPSHGTFDVFGQTVNGGFPSDPVVNGDFSTGRVSPWRLHTKSMTSMVGVVAGRAEILVGAGMSPTGADTSTQFWQKDLVLEGGTTYDLWFDASSSMGGNATVQVLQHGKPYENYGLRSAVAINPFVQTFHRTFTTTPGDKVDARISFLLTPYAKPGETYTFDNITLVKASFCGDGVVAPEDGETCEPSDVMGSGELVVDGGFEAGPFSGAWMETSTNFPTNIYDASPFEGSFHAWIGGLAALEEGSLTQTITLPDGPWALLSFQMWLAGCSGDPADFFEVRAGADVVFAIDMTDDRCNNGIYRPEVVDLSAYTGQTIDLTLFGSTGNNGMLSNIFIDNVSLEVAPVDCRDDCTYCGDGVVDAVEDCDPGDPMGPPCTEGCMLVP